jgi:hypothetical protein
MGRRVLGSHHQFNRPTTSSIGRGVSGVAVECSCLGWSGGPRRFWRVPRVCYEVSEYLAVYYSQFGAELPNRADNT